MLSVFKYMKDVWEKGKVVMGALKIKTVKDLAKKAQEQLSNKEIELLKKWFDDGMWFDALMNAESSRADGSAGTSGYACVEPSENDIEAAIVKRVGEDRQYTIVSTTLSAIRPDVNSDQFGAWFINGCNFKWKVVYE